MLTHSQLPHQVEPRNKPSSDDTHRKLCKAKFRQRRTGIRRMRPGWSRLRYIAKARLLKEGVSATCRDDGENHISFDALNLWAEKREFAGTLEQDRSTRNLSVTMALRFLSIQYGSCWRRVQLPKFFCLESMGRKTSLDCAHNLRIAVETGFAGSTSRRESFGFVRRAAETRCAGFRCVKRNQQRGSYWGQAHSACREGLRWALCFW